MCKKTPIERTVYINGENGIVRLPAPIWTAFYEAAILLEIESTQECFIRYILSGGRVTWQTRLDNVLHVLERSAFVMGLAKWELEYAEVATPREKEHPGEVTATTPRHAGECSDCGKEHGSLDHYGRCPSCRTIWNS